MAKLVAKDLTISQGPGPKPCSRILWYSLASGLVHVMHHRCIIVVSSLFHHCSMFIHVYIIIHRRFYIAFCRANLDVVCVAKQSTSSQNGLCRSCEHAGPFDVKSLQRAHLGKALTTSWMTIWQDVCCDSAAYQLSIAFHSFILDAQKRYDFCFKH